MTGENNRIAFGINNLRVGILVNAFAGVTLEVSVSVGVFCFILGVIMVTGSIVPVMSFILRPFGREGVLASVSANVTNTVGILVAMSGEAIGYVVSALGSVPVIVFIGRPFGFVFVIAELIFTNVTNTVVVFVVVCMKSKLALSVVSTGRSVPVVSDVLFPSFSIEGVLAHLICANVTNTVVISVGMSSKVALYNLTLNCVRAEGLVPVVVFIGFPFGAKIGMVTELIFTLVADTVVICITLGVELFVFGNGCVRAGCCIPVLLVVM